MTAARGGMLGGLLASAVIALWWLTATRHALGTLPAAPLTAREAAAALALIEALALALVAPRLGAGRGLAPALAAIGAFLVAPAPLWVLLWSTSGAPTVAFAVIAAGVAVGACALALAGAGLARGFGTLGVAVPLATVLGVIVAGLAWSSRAAWLAGLG